MLERLKKASLIVDWDFVRRALELRSTWYSYALQPSRCLFQDLCARDGLWSSMGDDDDDDDDFLGVMPLDGAGRRRKKRVSSASACPIPIRLP